MNYLISFATKEPIDYTKSQKRLKNSVKKYHCFHHIYSFKNRNIDRDFQKMNKSILSESKGCGYWLWKPYFIYRTLNKMKEGDILFYCDSGSEFITNPSVLLSLVNAKIPIALFKTHEHLNSEWTKYDTFKLMDCEGPEYYNAEQVAAGFQIYYKCSVTLRFVEEYLSFCRDRSILTDDCSITGEDFPEFKGTPA